MEKTPHALCRYSYRRAQCFHLRRLPNLRMASPLRVVLFMVLLCCLGCRGSKVVKGTLKPAEGGVVAPPPKGGGSAFAREYAQRLGVPVPAHASPALIMAVADWMGTPYKFGGNDRNGIDCSAFINRVFTQAYSFTLPRTTQQMFEKANTVGSRDMREGDIVFFKINTLKVGHAGILLFDDYFAHASSSRGVMISRLREPYWTRYFVGTGRFDIPAKK